MSMPTVAVNTVGAAGSSRPARIAFVGDLHGRVFHAIAGLTTWQARLGRPFDALIQVGDLGHPEASRVALEEGGDYARCLQLDPTEADLGKLLRASPPVVERLRRLRALLNGPILSIRGNHDVDWLADLPLQPGEKTAPIDPYDLYRFVPDATVLNLSGLRFGFLGGAEEDPGPGSINPAAHSKLLALGPGVIDVLVTHQGPLGSTRGPSGELWGSPLISELVAALRPRYHVAGHVHAACGPRRYGETVYVGLDGVAPTPTTNVKPCGLLPGCMALLDTQVGTLAPLSEPWLSDFPMPFDFGDWLERADVLARP